MKRLPHLLLSVCLLVYFAADPCSAQSPTKADPRSSQADLVRTRRVGHLSRNRDGSGGFKMTDVWDKQAYLISPAKGLDLDPYVDRYVALHGTTRNSTGPERQFLVEKVIDLDSRRRRGRPAVAYAPKQADHEDHPGHRHQNEILPVQHLEVQMPSQALEPGIGVEPIPMGEIIDVPAVGEDYLEPLIEGYATEPCAGCGLSDWSPGIGLGSLLCRDGTCCGPPESFWIRAEYLWWWTDGLRVPPLVTTSPVGTLRAAAGVLGPAGTRVLNPVAVNNDAHAGLRIRAGTWIGSGNRLGIGGDYYGMNDQLARFSASSTGTPILARPFFDALNGRETAELVAFPGIVGGAVTTEARTEFQSAGIHLRFNLCCADWSNGCGHSGSRLDGILGYRYARLADDLAVTENLVSQDPQNPGSFQIRDFFDTGNEFHGAEVGVQYQRRSGRWMVEALSKLALGNNHQIVTIDGSTRIVTGGVDTTLPGGILAQRTNIGRHVRDELAIIPELGVTLGYQLTSRFSLTLGYTLVYFSNVVRAGDQVDLDLNPNLFPPEAVPFAGPLRPQFAFRETDFWAQGLSFGGDFRW